MKLFAVLIALALTIPSFAQSDSIALLEKKLDQMQYQFYVLQSKVDNIDHDFSSFKNISSDSINLLMQENEILALRLGKNESEIGNQKESIGMIEKTQATQGGLLENFLWIVALGFLLMIAIFIYSFIHHRKRINSQRDLLERLFTDNLRRLETELKEIAAANSAKTLKLESELNSFSSETKEQNEKIVLTLDEAASKSANKHLELEEAIKNSEKELSKNLSTLKAKVTKTEKIFIGADKTLATAIKKNEKDLKEKIDKLKTAAKKDNEALVKKIQDQLKKSDKKVDDLKKVFEKTQKRKAVTFKVKKSG